MKVGIIGSTGYAGQQLVGLLQDHPEVEIEFLSSHTYKGKSFSDVYKRYQGVVDRSCIGLDEALGKIKTIDLLFIALPHGKSLEMINQMKTENIKIIDFGADFRMNNVDIIKSWYNLDHKDDLFLKKAIYGLPELNRDKIKEAFVVANPGCYPTASILGLLPILDDDLIDSSSIIIDAKSGVTGAGRSTNLSLSYCESNENLKAYAVGSHRHTPEIEEIISQKMDKQIFLSFTPHLVPMQRGILSTVYVTLKSHITENEIIERYKSYYSKEPFVRIIDGLPETKAVTRSNYCDIGIRLDKRTNRLVVVSVIDNLVKGAAGQAIQNMNLMMGYPETTGLSGNNYYL